MKEKILACICASALLVPFFGCGGNNATDNINANVNEWTEFTALCADGDAFYNTEVSGGAYRINGSKILFEETGKYILTHADDSRTEIEVTDKVAPQIFVELTDFKPELNIACALPKITVMDGYDGRIENYEVQIDGKTADGITFTGYGSKKMTVTATDKSGNKASKVVTLECVPPTDVAVPVGTTVNLGGSFFYGLDETAYKYSFTVTKIDGTERKVFPLIKSFTVEKDCCYEVKGVATDGFGDKTETYRLYYDEDISVMTFNYLGNGLFLQDETDFYLQYSVFKKVVNGNNTEFVTSPAYSRIVDGQNDGNGRLAISSASENIWAWRFALKGEHRAGTLYFDLAFERDDEEWLFEIIPNEQIFYNDAGRYCVRMEVSQSDISYRFGVNGPKLTDNTVYLDNILFVPD